MEHQHNTALHLLPSPRSHTAAESSLLRLRSSTTTTETGPSLDLQLSISVGSTAVVEAMKWEAAEQIRLAAMEKAYAERVRELTRREMEMAELEFSRAREIWEMAREEVERAERMREMATMQVDSTCMEITCHSCRQRFRPA
ncbi:hypothetical protein Lal_00023978 [Lupinus albus]|uniref:Uncharacterized protein n=1 Tax=Lupinus albus TaxID=3870 RepID=A0A6A4PIU0_LUPAL|nr:hypothetical protein Lalb_Chr13g0297231 [Lupinus albus]KAF1887969.1 hypothetical protein Lal_00023978 [Lupinus albus]